MVCRRTLNEYDVHHWLWNHRDAEEWFTAAGFVETRDWNPIQGWKAQYQLNWTPPELGENPNWYRTEWYHWLFFEGRKPSL